MLLNAVECFACIVLYSMQSSQAQPNLLQQRCKSCQDASFALVVVQVVEESGDKGLTAAKITEQVLSRRPSAYPHSVRGERSRVRSAVYSLYSDLYRFI